jgi:hypothetical protein
MNNRGTNVDRDIGRHLPEIGSLEQRDHPVRHELFILIPVLHGYLRPGRYGVRGGAVGAGRYGRSRRQASRDDYCEYQFQR